MSSDPRNTAKGLPTTHVVGYDLSSLTGLAEVGERASVLRHRP